MLNSVQTDRLSLLTELASVFFIFTIFTMSRMSRSGQSCIVTGVVSSEPPKRMWIIAGLSPGKLGPRYKKEWPIIRPATVNMSLSRSSSKTEGMRWSGSPSKILLMATFPVTVKDLEEKSVRARLMTNLPVSVELTSIFSVSLLLYYSVTGCNSR